MNSALMTRIKFFDNWTFVFILGHWILIGKNRLKGSQANVKIEKKTFDGNHLNHLEIYTQKLTQVSQPKINSLSNYNHGRTFEGSIMS